MSALSQWPLNEWAEIVTIQGDEDLKMRLAELSFVPGLRLRIVARAPMRGPLVVELDEDRIALRELEADCIKVQTPAKL